MHFLAYRCIKLHTCNTQCVSCNQGALSLFDLSMIFQGNLKTFTRVNITLLFCPVITSNFPLRALGEYLKLT